MRDFGKILRLVQKIHRLERENHRLRCGLKPGIGPGERLVETAQGWRVVRDEFGRE
jgi:hypothetical protein